MTTTYTPDGLYEISTAAAGLAEGERRRDAAHDLLRTRRAVFVRRGQRALLLRLLHAGTATADDVAAAVTLPPDIDGRCLGAAPGPLVRLGLVELAGYERSSRPHRHASPQAVWKLRDRDGAAQWLDAHPDLPDSADDQGRAAVQLTLAYHQQRETPPVAADGVSF